MKVVVRRQSKRQRIAATLRSGQAHRDKPLRGVDKTNPMEPQPGPERRGDNHSDGRQPGAVSVHEGFDHLANERFYN